jgi:EmrB/QacA subfamily drug resistance transporter
MKARTVLLLVCVTSFMLVLDLTAVIVALANMQRELAVGISVTQWVVDAYALTMATFLLASAALSDRVGRSPLFLAGTAVFTAGSLGCGVAPTVLVLVFMRALQGAGGAVLFGLALPMIADAYPEGGARDRAIGVFGAVSGGAVAAGPLVGGLLTDVFGWRLIFFVNVPVGLLCLWGQVRAGRAAGRGQPRGEIDLTGTVAVTAAVFLLVLALTRGNALGWWRSAAFLTMLVAAGLLLAVFALAEKRSRHPLFELGLFRRRSYLAVAITALVVHAVVVGSLVYISITLQNALGYSPLAAGLVVLPFSVAAFLSAPVVARRMARLPTRVVVPVTAVLAAAGLAATALWWDGSSWASLAPGFVIMGITLGVSLTALNRLALREVQPSQYGMAAGGVVALRQVGVAVGVALLGAVYQHALSGHVPPRAVDAAHEVLRGAVLISLGSAVLAWTILSVRHPRRKHVGEMHIIAHPTAAKPD